VLGFVTFFGGAILWVRAREAGLPGNEVVAVVPKGVLITTGASFLVPAVLLALLAVGSLYAVHVAIDLKRRIQHRELRRRANEAEKAAAKAAIEAAPKQELAEKDSEIADDLDAALAKATERSGADPADTAGLRAEVEDRNRRAQRRAAEAAEARGQAERLAAMAAHRRMELDLALAAPRGVLKFVAEIVATVIVLVVLPLWGIDWSAFNLDFWPAVALVLLAVAVPAVSLVAYFAWGKFLWFGVVAFVAVGVFIGFATYFRTVDDPKVEAGVALRGDRPPVVGLFVAETSSTVYLGTFDEGHGHRRLLAIPRSDVVDIAVGPLLSPEKAELRALGLAVDLCEQQREPKDGTKASCSVRETAALRARLAFAEGRDNSRATRLRAAFTRPPEMFNQVRRKRGLCLVRYEDQSADAHPSGAWWASCKAVRGLRSIDSIRARLALTTGFQETVDYRLRAKLPANTPVSYLAGLAAPQCEKPDKALRCYKGGAAQYWFFDAAVPARWVTRRECLADDKGASWKAC
jgi:hypothetical protein